MLFTGSVRASRAARGGPPRAEAETRGAAVVVAEQADEGRAIPGALGDAERQAPPVEGLERVARRRRAARCALSCVAR